MAVLGLVNAHTPEEDTRAVPVPFDHLPDILLGDLLPLFVPYILPAWDLFKNHQPDLIAAVQEVPGLGIVAGPDQVKAKFVFENIRIFLLYPLRHGIAHIGEGLVPV